MGTTMLVLVFITALLSAMGGNIKLVAVVEAWRPDCGTTVGWCEPRLASRDPYPIPEHLLAVGTKSGSVQEIQLTHSSGDIGWFSSISNSSNVFPVKCQSDKTVEENPYGFMKFKSEIFPPLPAKIDGRDRSVRTIAITVQQVVGFTATQDETITCGPPFLDKNGSPFFYSRTGQTTIPRSEQKMSFKIISMPHLVRFIVLSNKDDHGANGRPRWYESHVRNFGVELYFTVEKDAFVGEEVISTIFNSLSCRLENPDNPDAATVPTSCLQGVLQRKHFSWSKNRPHQVIISVPKEELREYDISMIERWVFTLPNGGWNITLRGKTNGENRDGNIRSAETSIAIYPHPMKPKVYVESVTSFTATGTEPTPKSIFSPNIATWNKPNGNIFSLTEACIRGRYEEDSSCARMLRFKLLTEGPGASNSWASLNGFTSTNELNIGSTYYTLLGGNGIQSVKNNGLSFQYFITKLERASVDKSLMALYWHRFLEYEISENDYIRIKVTFDVMQRTCPTPDPSLSIRDDSCENTAIPLKKSEPVQEYTTNTHYASNMADNCGQESRLWADAAGLLRDASWVAQGAACPIIIRVSPSPGRIVGLLPTDFEAKNIWSGGTVVHIVFDGETFTDSALDWVLGQITSPTDSAWDSVHRDCIFPAGSAKFLKDPVTGVQNKSVVEISFATCEDYLITGDHQVSFLDTTKFLAKDSTTGEYLKRVWVSDQEPLLSASEGFTMTVRSSPGFIELVQGPNLISEELPDGALAFLFEESYVQNDIMNFTLRLRGNEWNSGGTPASLATFTDQCLAQFEKKFVVTPVATPDPNSFTSAAIKTSVAGKASWRVVDSRTLSFVAKGKGTGYNTLQGETIFMDFSQLPLECFKDSRPINRPSGNMTLKILPQNGLLTARFNFLVGEWESVENNPLSENSFRRSGFELVVDMAMDTFLLTDAGPNSFPISMRLHQNIRALEAEPDGFNKFKDSIIGPSSITIASNKSQVRFRFNRFLKYDIATNETIVVWFNSTMVASGRQPINPVISLPVFAAAGQVALVSWSGAANNNSLLESDFRLGKVWFNFSLLGDQWRRQRSPYVESFSSDDFTKHSFGTLIETIIPDMSFFIFTSSTTGFDYMRLQLQANERFNINTDETVTLDLSNRTIESGIQPVFFTQGIEASNLQFPIKVEPGQLIMSGTIYRLTEKMVRRGRIVIFLSLIGELWKISNNTLLDVLENINVVPNSINQGVVPPLGFELKRTEILTLSQMSFSPEGDQLTLELLPNRKYNIEHLETINISITGDMVQSGVAPRSTAGDLLLKIAPEGGELTTAEATATLSEAQVRNGAFINLRLDGDYWNASTFRRRSAEFIAGFSSLSPVVKEPHGFLANYLGMLTLGVPQIDEVAVKINPTPRYDIESDEIITFTVGDPSFVMTSMMPDPQTTTIRIIPDVEWLVVLADEKSERLGGRVNPDNFKASVAGLLGCGVDRIYLEINETEYRAEDGMKILLMYFKGHGGSTQARTNAELASILYGLQQDFLLSSLGVKWIYYQDAPPAYEDIHDPPPTTEAPVYPPTDSQFIFIVWIVAGIAFIALMVAGAYTFMQKMYSARKPGRTRPSSSLSGVDKYGGLEDIQADLAPAGVPITVPGYHRVVDRWNGPSETRTMKTVVQDLRDEERLQEQVQQRKKAAVAAELSREGVSSAERIAEADRVRAGLDFKIKKPKSLKSVEEKEEEKKRQLRELEEIEAANEVEELQLKREAVELQKHQKDGGEKGPVADTSEVSKTPAPEDEFTTVYVDQSGAPTNGGMKKRKKFIKKNLRAVNNAKHRKRAIVRKQAGGVTTTEDLNESTKLGESSEMTKKKKRLIQELEELEGKETEEEQKAEERAVAPREALKPVTDLSAVGVKKSSVVHTTSMKVSTINEDGTTTTVTEEGAGAEASVYREPETAKTLDVMLKLQ